MPVPDEVRAKVRAAATRDPRAVRELLYWSVCQGRNWRSLWPGASAADRAGLLLWRFWPSSTYMTWLAEIRRQPRRSGLRLRHLAGVFRELLRRAARFARPAHA